MMCKMMSVFFLTIYLVNHCLATERVNCRRVVFHPYCRGISAKRSNAKTENAAQSNKILSLPIIEQLQKSLSNSWKRLLFSKELEQPKRMSIGVEAPAFPQMDNRESIRHSIMLHLLGYKPKMIRAKFVNYFDLLRTT